LTVAVTLVEMVDDHDHGRPYLHCDCGERFLLYDAPSTLVVECRVGPPACPEQVEQRSEQSEQH
jgi:hypothetical protein